MKSCANCKSDNAEFDKSSGMWLCKNCLDRITKKLSEMGIMLDRMRDELKSGEFELERFPSCIGSCEANGHSSCRCGRNRN